MKRPAALGLATLALMFSAGTWNSAGADAAKHVTINFWNMAGSTQQNQTIGRLAKAFEKQHPGVTIAIDNLPAATYQASERAALAGKNGPDVLVNWPMVTLEFTQSLMPLTKYVTATQRRDLSGWFAWSTGAKVSGVPYGVPWQATGYIFLYNKALFKKAGLNPNAPPTTWAQLLQDCKALKAHHITPIEAGFKDGTDAENYMDVFGSEFLTPAQLANFPAHPNWTLPGIGRGMSYMVKLYKDGYMNQSAPGITLTPEAENAFAAGKAAILEDFPTNIPTYVSGIGAKNLGVMRPPVLPGSHYKQPRQDWMALYGLSITKWCPDPKVAYQWISFLTSAKSEQTEFQNGALMPNNNTTTVQTNVPALRDVLSWLKTPSRIYYGPDDTMQSGPEAVFDQLASPLLLGQVSIQSMMQQVEQAQKQTHSAS